jgi:hypothetical protein
MYVIEYANGYSSQPEPDWAPCYEPDGTVIKYNTKFEAIEEMNEWKKLHTVGMFRVRASKLYR